MDVLWRLLWALPLVVAVGVLAMLLLRRLLNRSAPLAAGGKRIALRESLCLSAETQIHLVELDGRLWLVSESSRQISLQPAHQQPAVASRAAMPLGRMLSRQLYRRALR